MSNPAGADLVRESAAGDQGGRDVTISADVELEPDFPGGHCLSFGGQHPLSPWDVAIMYEGGEFVAWRGGHPVKSVSTLDGADDAGLHLYVSEPDEDGVQHVCCRSRWS